MRILFLFALTCIFTGCSTLLTSQKVDSQKPHKDVGIPYFLPKTAFLVDLEIRDKIVEKVTQVEDKVVGKEQIIEYDAVVQVKQRSLPDPEEMYLIEYDSSIFYDDNIKVELSEEGFVKALLSQSLDEEAPDKGKEGEGTAPLSGSPMLMNFTTSLAPDKLSAEEQALASRLREDLKILKGKQSFVFSLESPKSEITLRNPLAKGQFKILFDAQKYFSRKKSPQTGQDNASTGEEPEEFDKGIKFKIAEPYLVKFELVYIDTSGNTSSLSKLSTIALLPDDSPVFTLPIERYALVKATLDAEFKNGVLKKSQWEKPSIILKILNLPKNLFDQLTEIIEAIAAAAKAQAGTVAGG